MARTTGSSGEKTDAAVREAALSLMARYGYEAVSMRQLAAEIGVQAAALYRYYPTKEDLLQSLLREHMEKLSAGWDEAEPIDGDATERLAAFVRHHVHFHITRRHSTHVSNMELRSLSPERLTAILKLLGDEVEALRDMVRRFAQERIAPIAAETDQKNEFPNHLWKELGDLGLLGITADPDFGGSGMGYLAHVRRDGGDLPRLGLGRPLLRRALQPLRQPDQPQRHAGAEGPATCRPLISGEHVGALAMSEPGSGSDVVSMRLRAEKRNDRYMLNGTKMWITNGPDADTLVVYAKTDPEKHSRGITAFLVEKGFTRLLGGAEAGQARHARLQHRRTGVRGCRGAGGERAARGRQRRRRTC
jgi:AcrR family transcriptional regulator